MRMSSHGTGETQVASFHRLPCIESNVALQNAYGDMLDLSGYSYPGGLDIGS